MNQERLTPSEVTSRLVEFEDKYNDKKMTIQVERYNINDAGGYFMCHCEFNGAKDDYKGRMKVNEFLRNRFRNFLIVLFPGFSLLLETLREGNFPTSFDILITLFPIRGYWDREKSVPQKTKCSDRNFEQGSPIEALTEFEQGGSIRSLR
jgi:hypothetical protein